MTSPVLPRAGKPLAIAAAIAAAFTVSAHAQEKKLDSVVVTATRSPQIAREVLADNVVITSEEIARSGGNSLADVLQRQRGIELVRNGGPGAQSSVFIRGTDNKQNIVLVDGVRVGSATAGGASWNAIPLSQIERVEIVYGPLSTMYGADAVGGVVQIFTKQGDGAPVVTASAGAGSYGTRSTDAGVSGSSDGFRYAIRAGHEQSDGFSATKRGNFSFNPDRDGYSNTSASGQFGYQLAKGHELGATFLHSVLKNQFDSGPTMDDRGRTRVGAYSIYAKNKLMPNWDSHLQLSQSADHSTNDASFGHTEYDTDQTTLSWQNNFMFGTNVLQAIVEHRKEEVDSSVPSMVRDRTTNSVALAYQMRSGAHLGAVSLRGDDSSQFGSRTTGSVSYGYRLTSALRVNASAGTSFRAPTFNELYFPNFGIPTLRPEKGRNAEIGMYYEDGASQYSAVYYRNRLTDLLVFTPVCPVTPAAFPIGCTYNVNEALISGLSLGASTTAGQFTFRGSLDFQDPKDETTGRRLARRAKKHGTLAVDYKAGDVTTGAELVFSGDRFDNVTNTNRLGGYGVLNLHVGYDLSKDWSLFARWNNVFDKNYELARLFATAGSNVFVGVRYAMK
ncbi:TonB-dependent receptor domain-containing protein [Noviherbaspirillum denitrificans]|uniref:TonB-dependent vitamin B12 receptor n=1 Tax=Noviherbaspirillum denitrificans TaxID=1968433 RepID=A0A254TBB8_9BURK|nr:TonB-dependent receptor [Noviherbaspirillum denitrificans]OWW19845.1 TonB-dependent vitamin B12 receptor [Noviherbaspirillum denitrificans]